jgi:site-specific recombinase XerD
MTARRTRPDDLAGRRLTKFFIDHLAGERAASPRTIASYRDAVKLLLVWFQTAERIPPEKLRLTDIDQPRVLRFLDWLQAERSCSEATRNQRLAVIKSFRRYTAVEQPDHLEQVTQILAIRQQKTPSPQLGHLTAAEGKVLLAQPGTASGRAVRDTALLTLAYDSAARVQELCDLDIADARTANPTILTIHGKGSKTPYVPVMDPPARCSPTTSTISTHTQAQRRRDPAVPRTQPLPADQIRDRQTPRPHVQRVRARDPDWARGLEVTTHTLRRTRAMHLIQAGVNLIYIRDLLGRADISTTEIDASADAETKRKAIENAYQPLTPHAMPDWTADPSLIACSLGR